MRWDNTREHILIGDFTLIVKNFNDKVHFTQHWHYSGYELLKIGQA